jgi:nitroreductase
MTYLIGVDKMKLRICALVLCIVCLFTLTSCASPPLPEANTPQESPASATSAPPPATAEVAEADNMDVHRRIAENPVLEALTTSFSARLFTPGEIPRYDIEAILLSGARAQSARNAQPWRFTVITNYADVRQIHANAAEGNIIIVISGRIDNPLPTTEFDCGIAAAYMQIAAEALGYGARMLISPVNRIEERRADFDIPEGYRVVMAIIVGTADDAIDGFTSATPRNPLSDIVNWAQ